jgi:serine/threonine protein kinase
MSGVLRSKQKLFFNFLKSRRAGEVVTESDILAQSQWAPATLSAYRAKNYIDPFLDAIGRGKYRIRKDGQTISEGDVADAFTQVRPETLQLAKGTKLHGLHDTYELIEFKGNGAVAHVWSSSVRASGVERAAKIVNPRLDLLEPATLENVRKRFAREAKYGERLSHPNLVPYRDSGTLNGHPFLIMDLAETSVAEMLSKGQLTVAKSVEIVAACLNALHYLHGLGCVHRDVKPHNLLRFGDRFVLGDLGIVNWSDMNPAFTSAGTITRDSVQLGSWYYMAPEQRAAPHEATALSDVYALGVSWYQMLTGRTPDPASVAAQRFPPATANVRVEQLIRRMLTFDAAVRPSIAELKQQVESIQGDCEATR